MIARLSVLVSALALLGPNGGDVSQTRADQPISYQVVRVKGKLVQQLAAKDQRLEVGDQLRSGDHLRTGWFSSAGITAPDWAARFQLGPRTRVQLAGERPGLLLLVDRGRVLSSFDPLAPEAENEAAERTVTTPSVILAVRGTEYSVAVDSAGNTTVAVFAGTVEAVDIGRTSAPVQVNSGHACTIRRGKAPATPVPHNWHRRNWQKVPMPRHHGQHRSGAYRQGSPDGGRSGRSGQGGQGGRGGKGGSKGHGK